MDAEGSINLDEGDGAHTHGFLRRRRAACGGHSVRAGDDRDRFMSVEEYEADLRSERSSCGLPALKPAAAHYVMVD